MVEHLGPDNAQVVLLDYETFFAQSKWQEGVDRMENLPKDATAWHSWPWRTTFLYLAAGNFDKAYESLLKWMPDILDRESWEQGGGGVGAFNCNYAGILINVGEEETGRDLLQLITNNIEEIPTSERTKRTSVFGIGALGMAECYILAGDHDQAMDLLEANISQPGIISRWYEWGKRGPYKQLENNSRYIGLVNTIEAKLAAQRALLAEMDALESDLP